MVCNIIKALLSACCGIWKKHVLRLAKLRFPNFKRNSRKNNHFHPCTDIRAYHISMGVEYSVDPSRTSGGRYHNVTTSLEYVFVGTDLALARPEDKTNAREIQLQLLIKTYIKPIFVLHKTNLFLQSNSMLRTVVDITVMHGPFSLIDSLRELSSLNSVALVLSNRTITRCL